MIRTKLVNITTIVRNRMRIEKKSGKDKEEPSENLEVRLTFAKNLFKLLLKVC